MRSSASWNAIPSRSPYSRSVSMVSASHPLNIAPYRAAVAMRTPVLSASTCEVVVQRVGPRGRGGSSRIWPEHEPHEGPGLDLHGLGTEVGDDRGRGAEEQVADEDGRGVVVLRVGAGGAAAHVRLVHDVVVVERGEVGQLDPGGRATTSSLIPVPTSDASRVSSGRNRLPPASARWMLASAMNSSSWSTSRRSSASTAARPSTSRAFERVGRGGEGQDRRRGARVSGSGHRTRNCDDRSARSRTCAGSTPRTSVTSVPMVIATVM